MAPAPAAAARGPLSSGTAGSGLAVGGMVPLDTIHRMQCQMLHLPSSSSTAVRTFPNPDLVIGLGVGLQCSPTGLASAPKVPIDAAFVSKFLVDLEGSKFQKGASTAAEALLRAHASWPSDRFRVAWPNATKSKAAAAGRGGSVEDQTGPSRVSGSAQEGGEEGGSGAEGEEGGDERVEREGGEGADAAPQSLRFPPGGRRRVLKPGAARASNATSKLGQSVHEGASWFMAFSCSMMSDGCPVTGILMQLAGEDDKLHIRFSSACSHLPAATAKGQLRGAQRGNLVEKVMGSGGGHNASVLHNSTLAARPAEQQLCQDVSLSGANPQVIRQALHEARAATSKYDGEQLESARKRMLTTSKADLASTPDEDRKDRLWGGDIALFMQEPDGSFMIVRMMDLQLWRWVHLCMRGGGRGAGGVYMDTTEGQASFTPCQIRRK